MKRMTRAAVTLLLGLTLGGALAVSGTAIKTVNGKVEVITVEAINGGAVKHRVVHVWGTPYQMGYAQGRLLASDIKTLIEHYALPMLGVSLYKKLYLLVPAIIKVPKPYRQELDGMLAGIKESSGGLHIDTLGRDLTVWDLVFANIIPDVNGFGCSTVTAWGAATKKDPALGGKLVSVRNLDFFVPKAQEVVYDRQIVLVYHPSDPKRQPWASVGFPGFIGTLSGFNAEGTGAYINLGGRHLNFLQTGVTNRYLPITWAIRAGLECKDCDGDGEHTIKDVNHAVTGDKSFGTYEITLVSPSTDKIPAAVLEYGTIKGSTLRYADFEKLQGGDLLMVTNHDRKLTKPQHCSRYQKALKLFKAWGGNLSEARALELEQEISENISYQTGMNFHTIYTITYLADDGVLKVRFGGVDAPAAYAEPLVLKLKELFKLP